MNTRNIKYIKIDLNRRKRQGLPLRSKITVIKNIPKVKKPVMVKNPTHRGDP